MAGTYYADASDASKQRRWEAEERVRKAAREARRCVWCSKVIHDGETFIEIAGRNLHESCTAEFDEWAYGSAPKVEAV